MSAHVGTMLVVFTGYDAHLKPWQLEVCAEGKPLDAVGDDILGLFMVI